MERYDFAMIGIGVMGSNLLLNMADKGFAVIGYDINQGRVNKLVAAAGEGTTVGGTTDVQQMMQQLKKPRKIMMLVPAGNAVDDVIENLLPLLEAGDILIDGGNSHFGDTQRRYSFLQPKGIHFFGMGVSGGEEGARYGPSLMPGGDKEAYSYLQPILEAVAAKVGGKPCVAYTGDGAAGHYVKMVHNGIEYAMMQCIAEAYDYLKRVLGLNNHQLHQTFSQWNKGKLSSFLLEITAEIFRTLDVESESDNDYLVDKILDKAGSKGTGKWTSEEGLKLSVPIPLIDAAVTVRALSAFKNERLWAHQLYQHTVDSPRKSTAGAPKELENALYFCFVTCYAQGLHLLNTASYGYNMNIRMGNIIPIWKGGCIIRSNILVELEKSYRADADLVNPLLSPIMVPKLKRAANSIRKIIARGVKAQLPLPAFTSALSYFDSFCSDKLPINLVQAQRDFFGAHTYERNDKEGVFHTEWHAVPKFSL